jgi:hypothetical protein
VTKRVGKIERRVSRALITAKGPLTTAQLVRLCWPDKTGRFEYGNEDRSLRRAAAKFADKRRSERGSGRQNLYSPNRALARLIRGE